MGLAAGRCFSSFLSLFGAENDDFGLFAPEGGA